MLPTARDIGADTVSAEKSAYAKVNLRILIPLGLCFMLAFLDRINVGFAYLHMKTDVGLDEAAFGIGVGLFFISYTLFEVPSNLLLTRVGAKKTISRIMVLWGLASSATMFVQTPMQFYVTRLALGVAEAGFFPGAMLILTYWYPAQKRARVIALFSLAVPLAGMIGSPLSGWIMQTFNGVGGLKDWQWIFLIEGMLPVVVGVLMYFLLTDKPESAEWLSQEEREVVVSAIQEEHSAKGHDDKTKHFSAAIRSPRLYIVALAYFPVAWAGNVLNYWAPALIRHLAGGNVLNIGLLLAIPSTIGAVGMLLVCHHSDKKLERRWHWAVSAILTACASIALTMSGHSLVAMMIALCVLNIGYLCIAALFFTIPTAFLSGTAAAGGLALVSACGQVGGFLAPVAIGHIKAATGSFSPAFVLVAALLVMAACVVIGLIPASILVRKSNA
ncbi:MFS transporter [Trinickia caryophylli]|uniref:MFS transporter, ACS family, phthalate transporter n=1 Tax=Trinickia caryophylli TaxID=28094 RepID=A0A1X7H8Q5_TRICW|nr:MFS transporter [Trinickia caryophylli]TRX14092.1 MFS transporter [Trinickia caryophylli]WQE13912.1 MFS transporter [Trinickia caryophylli]GLU35745.1 MFS transporter [Trinickia caryophylli]SMF81383.1 MFS transporter, ACS family, phthalate transporter [Trinickia caryophylli]